VTRLDVQLGVERADVAHFSSRHGKVAGDRTDLERVAPPRRLQRADRLVLLRHLAHLGVAVELNVGLRGAEPDVGADRDPQVIDLERVEEPVLELGTQVLESDQGAVDQVGDGRIGQIDDPLVDQVREVDHALVGGEVAREGRREQRAREPQIPRRHQREEVPHVDRLELGGVQVEQEHRSREILQPDRTADVELPAAAGDPHVAQDDGVSLERGAAGDRAEAHAESRDIHAAAADGHLPLEPRILPGALHLHVHREPPLHPADRRRERLHDPEVHAVGLGAHLERPVQPPLLRTGEPEVERQVRFHGENVLAGAPQIEVGVETAPVVVHHALHERRAEIAEPAVAQARGAADGGIARSAADLEAHAHFAIHAGRVPLDEAVEVGEV
jgi:hypothetical protein